ncbi:hypothetical protein [Acidithiobacillus sp.]|uniref:hypothetical protein n=1 Tax=Acidithiobacillus sp. TaxID=1872118 RepID=UPI003CFF213D
MATLTKQGQGIASRRKGADGERELIRLLRDAFPGLELRRDLRQYQTGGLTDVLGLPGYAVEVKRRRRITQGQVDAWWSPLARHADGVEPVLAYRQDKQGWRFRLFGAGNFWMETDFSGFCCILKGDIHDGTVKE